MQSVSHIDSLNFYIKSDFFIPWYDESKLKWIKDASYRQHYKVVF